MMTMTTLMIAAAAAVARVAVAWQSCVAGTAAHIVRRLHTRSPTFVPRTLY